MFAAKLLAVVTICTLLLLSAVTNRSSAKPSRTIETKEGQMLGDERGRTAEEEKPSEKPYPTPYEEEENRQRQREISRDTFLRLNPNPGEEAGEEIGQTNVNGEKRRHQQMGEEEAQESDQPPLRDGYTLMALTSDNALIERTTRMNNCRGDLFKHKVRMPGCRPKTIVNRFCHGNCASFYIPRLRSKKLKATFQSCAACVPTETDLIQVQLDCPEREERQLNRTVVRVKRCACRNIALEEEEEAEEANNQRRETETP